jgi:hypothetical protein
MTIRNRNRPSGVTVMLSEIEKKAVRKAADQAGLSLSVFIRLITMSAIQRGETITRSKAA